MHPQIFGRPSLSRLPPLAFPGLDLSLLSICFTISLAGGELCRPFQVHHTAFGALSGGLVVFHPPSRSPYFSKLSNAPGTLRDMRKKMRFPSTLSEQKIPLTGHRTCCSSASGIHLETRGHSRSWLEFTVRCCKRTQLCFC